MGDTNFLAVFLAALSTFVLGGLWYSVLFGKFWRKLVGLSDQELSKGTLRVFGLSFVLACVQALTLAAVMGPKPTVMYGLFAGVVTAAGWVATAFGINYLFERKPFGLFLINAGYNLVAFVLMGVIIGSFH